MFDHDIELRGRHAALVKDLVQWKVLPRYIDAYMLGAVMGLLTGRRSAVDTEGSDTARIFTEQLVREGSRLEFLYRLVMLVGNSNARDVSQRIDHAFRVGEESPEAMKASLALFEDYVRGGIEFLHEQFVRCTTEWDYVQTMHQLVSAPELTMYGVGPDELLAKVLKGQL